MRRENLLMKGVPPGDLPDVVHVDRPGRTRPADTAKKRIRPRDVARALGG